MNTPLRMAFLCLSAKWTTLFSRRRAESANEYLFVHARPHPGPMTRSLPLTRPSRAFASQIPFATSQVAQVPRGEGEALARVGKLGSQRLNPAFGYAKWMAALV